MPIDPSNPPTKTAQAAPRLLLAAAQCEDIDDFLEQALSLVGDAVGSDCLAVVCAEKGTWHSLSTRALPQPLPTELLADVLDAEQVQSSEKWLAAPLGNEGGQNELLVIYYAGERPKDIDQSLDALITLLGASLATVRRRVQQRRCIQRLEAILEIAGQWNQTHEMEPLLSQMAEASTRLIGAERASVFLWDRRNQILIGRPALGVEGGELRIPDDRGIVGQVIQTGQPRRVDADSQQDQIDRRTDQQLGFQTKTLLCVPLRGKSGRLFGAFEILNKLQGNFTHEDEAALVELAGHAAIALENTQQYEQLLSSRKQMADEAAQRVNLVGESPLIDALRDTVRRVADTDLAVLLLGENGTGKEVVSQMIHYLSRRRDEPFIAVNCAALTETLLESELFGHEKGAFTDAHQDRAGKFEVASGGTLLLDEIGELSLGGQAKLLRVLEEKTVVRVGGSAPIPTDARVIAATNQDLASMVQRKKFREDLYFRLNVVTMEVPPLRERGTDVLLLADYFLREFSVKARRKPPRLSDAAKKRLQSHPWPGNVRELRNLMERLAYLSKDEKIDAGELAFILAPGTAPGSISLQSSLAAATVQFQTDYIQKQIEACGGNMSEAAARMGLHRTNLYRKMRQLGMSVERE